MNTQSTAKSKNYIKELSTTFSYVHGCAFVTSSLICLNQGPDEIVKYHQFRLSSGKIISQKDINYKHVPFVLVSNWLVIFLSQYSF